MPTKALIPPTQQGQNNVPHQNCRSLESIALDCKIALQFEKHLPTKLYTLIFLQVFKQKNELEITRGSVHFETGYKSEGMHFETEKIPWISHEAK